MDDSSPAFLAIFFEDINIYMFFAMFLSIFIFMYAAIVKRGISLIQPLHVAAFYISVNLATMILYGDITTSICGVILVVESLLIIIFLPKSDRSSKKRKVFTLVSKNRMKSLSLIVSVIYFGLSLYILQKYSIPGLIDDEFKVLWSRYEPFVSFVYEGFGTIILSTITYDLLSLKNGSNTKKDVFLIFTKVIIVLFGSNLFRIKGFFVNVLTLVTLYAVQRSKTVKIDSKKLSIFFTAAFIIPLSFFYGNLESIVFLLNRILQSAEAVFWAIYYKFTTESLQYTNNFYIDTFKVITHTALGFDREAQGNMLAKKVPFIIQSETGGPNTNLFFHYIIGNLNIFELLLVFFLFLYLVIKIHDYFNSETSEIEPTQFLLCMPIYLSTATFFADAGFAFIVLGKSYICTVAISIIMGIFTPEKSKKSV
jgi:hypothetical protein